MNHLLTLLLLLASCAGADPVITGPGADVELEVAFPNLRIDQSIVDLQHPGDGSNRLFVVEQRGLIRVFENDPGVAAARVFLDLRGRVRSGGEMGLLGLAFHPDFERNGYFYVDYTAPDPLRTRISRFRADPADSGRADPASELVLLEVPQPYSNHNAGQIAFGPDGMLYVTLGDGGSGGDPQNNGQDRTTLLGSILRIDVDNPSGGRPYGIPADNPFAGNREDHREEIWAWGLRNPWRMSFDAETGRLWVADVGQNAYEEIDVVEKGRNYGWRVMEGMHCYGPSPCSREGLTPPVWAYGRDLGSSVTGGYVYRGARVPELAGAYVYADYVSGRIWALRPEGSGAPVNALLLDTPLNISSFGVDRENELYVLDHGGTIYRFRSSTGTGAHGSAGQPVRPGVLDAYPNPFAREATIRYRLDRSAEVEVEILDAAGRLVRQLFGGRAAAGELRLAWDGRGVSSGPLPNGVYLCRLRLDGRDAGVEKLVLMR